MASTDFRKEVTMPVRPRSVYTAHSYNQVMDSFYYFFNIVFYKHLNLDIINVQRNVTFFTSFHLFHNDPEGLLTVGYYVDTLSSGILRN